VNISNLEKISGRVVRRCTRELNLPGKTSGLRKMKVRRRAGPVRTCIKNRPEERRDSAGGRKGKYRHASTLRTKISRKSKSKRDRCSFKPKKSSYEGGSE